MELLDSCDLPGFKPGRIDIGYFKLTGPGTDARGVGVVAKLANFGPNTPATVIEQEKQRIAERTVALNGLREQAQRLAAP